MNSSDSTLLIYSNLLKHLKRGDSIQRRLGKALQTLGIAECLTEYSATVVGTIPLGIHTAKSDVDIICDSADPGLVVQKVDVLLQRKLGSAAKALQVRKSSTTSATIGSFSYEGFDFEIFIQNQLVQKQSAFVHFQVEERLLALFGEVLEKEIIRLKTEGLNTEAAFAKTIGLEGDPFSQMYDLLSFLSENPPELIVRRFAGHFKNSL